MSEQRSAIRIPAKGTKGTRIPGEKLLMRIGKPFMDQQVKKYRNAPGPEQGKFMGFPVLLLTTVGAKTGKEHTHVLGGFPDGKDAWLVIASKGGAPTHPNWYHNLQKHPEVTVEVGDEKFKASANVMDGDEYERLYQHHASINPGFHEYRTKTTRKIPVIVLERLSP